MERTEIGRFSFITDGNPASPVWVIQPMDDHDLEGMEKELRYIRKRTGGFFFIALLVNDWDDELSPWDAPPAFGDRGFGHGADDTLSYIFDVLLPYLREKNGEAEKKLILAGYSLAGLFALYGGYRGGFDAVVGASPSVWFEGFRDYVTGRDIKTGAVYLSLGNKEEKTRNPVMSRVGDEIRFLYDHLKDRADCVLEWNEGNHFIDSDIRTGKGIAWALKGLRDRGD